MKKASGEIGSVALLARVDPARVMAAANEELAHELSVLQQRFTLAAESLKRAFGMRKTLRNLRLGNTAGFEQESISDRVLDDLARLSSDLRSRLHSLTVNAQITGDGEETESEMQANMKRSRAVVNLLNVTLWVRLAIPMSSPLLTTKLRQTST
jgi:hypothetical protein